MREAAVAAVDLAVLAGFAAELAYRLDQQEQPAHTGVAGGQPAPVGVDRQGAVPQQAAPSTNAPPSPFAQNPRSSSVTRVI